MPDFLKINSVPFGLKDSGNTFVRAMSVILSSLRKFTGSFVDDVAVHSYQWKEHLDHLDRSEEIWAHTEPQKVSICSESSTDGLVNNTTRGVCCVGCLEEISELDIWHPILSSI